MKQDKGYLDKKSLSELLRHAKAMKKGRRIFLKEMVLC